MLKLKDKRGDFASVIIMTTIVFALALGAVFGSHAITTFMNEIAAQPELVNTTAAETMTNVAEKTPQYLDFFIFFFLVSMIIGMIIASIYVETNPAVMVTFIIVMFIALLLAGLFANVWWEISQETELSTTMSNFTFTNLILGKAFPVIVFVTMIIVIVILYGKTKGGGL